MNDLAEKALHGLDVVRCQVRDHPMVSLSVAGLLVSSAVVVAGGRAGATRDSRGLTNWLGLDDLRSAGSESVRRGLFVLAAVLVLVLLWLLTLEVVRRTRQPESRVWWVVAAWTVPFALGPPLLDTSVYTYAAFGLLQRAGDDPYTHAPNALGEVPVVAAIDPGQRGIPSGSGSLGSLLQHLAVSTAGGSAVGAVIALRVLGVLAAVAIGRLAADLGGGRAGEALALTSLNPLVLFYVVASPHLDGVMVALVLGAVAAAAQRRWTIAVALTAVAGSVTAPGLVLVPVVVAAHARARRTGRRWLRAGRDVAVSAVVVVGSGLIGGFGWMSTITDQFAATTPYAIANVVGRMFGPIVRGSSYDDLIASGRITAVIAAVAIVGYLVVTVRSRTLDRSVAYALLAVALLAPNLYPWYLLWGVVVLAPAASGVRRVWVLALSVAGCVLMPTGFGETATDVVAGVALGVVAIVAVVVLVVTAKRSAPAGDLTDGGADIGEVDGRGHHGDEREDVHDAAG